MELLLPIIFINFQTNIDASIILNVFVYIIIILISKIDEKMKKRKVDLQLYMVVSILIWMTREYWIA